MFRYKSAPLVKGLPGIFFPTRKRILQNSRLKDGEQQIESNCNSDFHWSKLKHDSCS